MILAFNNEIEIPGKAFTDEVDEGYRVQSHNIRTVSVYNFRFFGNEKSSRCQWDEQRLTLILLPPVSPAVPIQGNTNGIPRFSKFKLKGKQYIHLFNPPPIPMHPTIHWSALMSDKSLWKGLGTTI